MRILIADDSLVSRHLLEATLRKWGYDVVVACDGTEAWNHLQSDNPPPIAILDWIMPGLTGLEVCKNVRASARSGSKYTYILLLSSKSERQDLIEGLEAGADDYLAKPFDQHELKVRLRAGLRIVELQGQLVNAQEELREQATKDSLTRIWNRSSILDTFERELARGDRERRSLGVVLCDLDHFKAVNDTYGHLAGDAVLREFTRRLISSVRPYDAMGRYGGEEFLILLPGCDEPCTAMQGERMRLALCERPMKVNETEVTVTASFGATAWRPGSSPSIEGLIRAADNALYQAKNAGRNRIIVLPHEEEALVS